MPKKSVLTGLGVFTSDGTDDLRRGATFSAVRVTYGQEVITNADPYLEGNANSNFENLSGVAKGSQPPLLGYSAITFTNQTGVSAIHDGRPDWGNLQFSDDAGWRSVRTSWAEKEEMPLMGIGYASSTPLASVKWVNEGGVFDTVNLHYRDTDPDSYYGWALNTKYLHQGFPLIAQSVPRESFLLNDAEAIYPFLHQQSFASPYATEDRDYFNVEKAQSSLGVRGTEPSTSLNPLSLSTLDLNPVTFATLSAQPYVNLTVSGKLFPADRGVVALVRFPSDANANSVSFEGVPATNSLDVLRRCVGAINLGQGVGLNDGLAGGDLFDVSESEAFPSKRAGQYDLYELHTGNYVPRSTRTGAIPALGGGDPTLGRVRLLTDPLAFDVEDNTSVLGIPVLFSP